MNIKNPWGSERVNVANIFVEECLNLGLKNALFIKIFS